MTSYTKSTFGTLCYHYVRSESQEQKFPRILGFSQQSFSQHLGELEKYFEITSINHVKNFLKNNYNFNPSKPGLLFTFDDGLSDHFETAKILNKNMIKGVFFIPTCILEDEPANPNIIHYSIAKYGIEEFLNELHNILKKNDHATKNDIKYDKEIDDPWMKIDEIKYFFKYSLHYKISRKILLDLYENLLKNEFPNALEIMHLTEEQIKEILDMGHSIGTHTHTHISFAHSLSPNDLKNEFHYPKMKLEQTFNINCQLMSYPWGEKKDRMELEKILTDYNDYEFIFTTEEKFNSKNTHHFQIGRFQPSSSNNLFNPTKLLSYLEK